MASSLLLFITLSMPFSLVALVISASAFKYSGDFKSPFFSPNLRVSDQNILTQLCQYY